MEHNQDLTSLPSSVSIIEIETDQNFEICVPKGYSVDHNKIKRRIDSQSRSLFPQISATSAADEIVSIDDVVSYSVTEKREVIVSNFKTLYLSIFFQLIIVSTIAYYFYYPIALIWMITLDSILPAIVFIFEYYEIKSLSQLIKIEPFLVRYGYYLVTFATYHYIDSILWFKLTPYLYGILILCQMPVMISRITSFQAYQKYQMWIQHQIIHFVQLIICRRMSKVINDILKHHIQYNESRVEPSELMSIVDKLSFDHSIIFLKSCVIATLIFYLEIKEFKKSAIFLRQFWFSEFLGNRNANSSLDDLNYLRRIVAKKEWNQLLDPYTLNRLMQFYLKLNNTTNGGIFPSHQSARACIAISATKFMVAWTAFTMMTFRSSGVLIYSVFVFKDRGARLLIKLAIILIYVILSIVSTEQVLFILLCELTTLLIVNDVGIGVIKDLSNIIHSRIFPINWSARIVQLTFIHLVYAALFYGGTNSHIIIIPMLLACQVLVFSQNREMVTVNAMFLLGYVSDYDPIHLAIISLVCSYLNRNRNGAYIVSFSELDKSWFSWKPGKTFQKLATRY